MTLNTTDFILTAANEVKSHSKEISISSWGNTYNPIMSVVASDKRPESHINLPSIRQILLGHDIDNETACFPIYVLCTVIPVVFGANRIFHVNGEMKEVQKINKRGGRIQAKLTFSILPSHSLFWANSAMKAWCFNHFL